MKKKVGILTFHRADNLGAVLQGYALQNALEENFPVEAQIIDYKCSEVEKEKRSRGVKGFLLKVYYRVKHRGFQKFRKTHLKLTDVYTQNTIMGMCEKFDAVITGSDQVWNYECSGWDNTYFLNFLPQETRKYSYAASLGRYRFSDEEKENVQKFLSTFDGISVRETVAKQHLESFLKKEIQVLPDPVFLLSKERWQKVMSQRILKEKYVFVYLVLPDVHVMEAATLYAKQHGCKLICNKTSLEFILNGSPSDFLSWVYYADRVFTTSFHGTAFSMLFEKELGVDDALRDGTPNTRVRELIQKTGNDACVLRGNGDCGAQSYTGDVMEAMRQTGYAYLAEICR